MGINYVLFFFLIIVHLISLLRISEKNSAFSVVLSLEQNLVRLSNSINNDATIVLKERSTTSKEIEDLSIYVTDQLKYERENVTRKNLNCTSLYKSTASVSLVMILTTHKLCKKCNNTILSLKYFKEEFGVVPIVFTESKAVADYCKSLGITSMEIIHTNKFGLPIFPDMITAARQYIQRDFYMYINSDILMNPLIIATINQLNTCIPSPSLYCGRVFETKKVPNDVNYRDPNLFSSLNKMKARLRVFWAVDYFIFSSDFPFEKLSPIVVGRYAVDSSIMMTAHNYNVTVVDMTNLCSYHQGRDSSLHLFNNVTTEDWRWNYQFIDGREMKTNGALLSNYLIRSKSDNAYDYSF